MSFSSIRGHAPVIEGLQSAWRHDRASHAYLFSGPDGIGKQLVARAFIQLLACASPSEDAEPCGACRTCRLFAERRHPDLIELEADGRFIKIDQVREMTRGLRYPPVEARIRAIVIHDAETMHEAAANAILKTLEEPSARTLFVLLSAQPNALLPTVLSRCQQVRFSALHREDVAAWLQAEHETSADEADELAAMSGGSLGAAAGLLDERLVALRERWLRALAELPRATPTALLNMAEEMAGLKEDLPAVLDVLRIGLRDAMLRASGAPDGLLTFRRRTLFGGLETEGALSALAQIDDVERARRFNVNGRLMAEHLLMGIRRAMR